MPVTGLEATLHCERIARHAVTENEIDKTKKQAFYQAAVQMVMRDYPVIPLFQPTYSKLLKPYVKGLDIEHNHFNVEQSKWIKFSDAK